MNTLIRTKRNGCFTVGETYFGSYLKPCEDPLANAEVTPEHLKQFNIKKDFNKIPADLWQRWVQLCFHCCDKVNSTTEVTCRFLVSETDPSKWRICIPPQKVNGGLAKADVFDDSIDIETGENIPSWPPEGWLPVGSSHSHNTMYPSPSPTDDGSELGEPGLHIIIGSINLTTRRYGIYCSVTANQRRFRIEYEEVLNSEALEEISFHPEVLKNIQLFTYTVPKSRNRGGFSRQNYSNTSYGRQQYRGAFNGQLNSWADPDVKDLMAALNAEIDGMDPKHDSEEIEYLTRQLQYALQELRKKSAANTTKPAAQQTRPALAPAGGTGSNVINESESKWPDGNKQTTPSTSAPSTT